MGDCDDSSELRVWRPDGGTAADPRSPPELMGPYELTDPYHYAHFAVRSRCHLVGTALHEHQEARPRAQALHDGLQRLPGHLFGLAFLGGNIFHLFLFVTVYKNFGLSSCYQYEAGHCQK